jgi:hypothetical protein
MLKEHGESRGALGVLAASAGPAILLPTAMAAEVISVEGVLEATSGAAVLAAGVEISAVAAPQGTGEEGLLWP